jgi:hypothetical protein
MKVGLDDGVAVDAERVGATVWTWVSCIWLKFVDEGRPIITNSTFLLFFHW